MVRESLEIVRASSAPVNQVLAQMLKPDEKAAIRKLNNRHSARRSYEKRRERMKCLAQENDELRSAILQMQTLQTARHRLSVNKSPLLLEAAAVTPPTNVSHCTVCSDTKSATGCALQVVADELAGIEALLGVGRQPVEFISRSPSRSLARLAVA